MLKKRKQHSPETKLQAVLESYASGNISDTAVSYGIHVSVLNKWRDQMKKEGVNIFNSKQGKNQHSRNKEDQLERIIGRQTIQIEILKKTAELLN